MTKKDYQLIAAILVKCQDDAETDILPIINRFATELAKTNPRFDSKRFVHACLEGPSV